MAIYMKINGANGDVTEQAHNNQIEVLDLQWSMSRTVRSAVGVGKQRESTSAYVSEMSVTKYIDSASHAIAQKAFSGNAETSPIQIDFTRVSEGEETVFRTIELTDAIMSGLVNSGAASSRPTEVITFNFTQIQISDHAESETGTSTSVPRVTYNLATAKTS